MNEPVSSSTQELGQKDVIQTNSNMHKHKGALQVTMVGFCQFKHFRIQTMLVGSSLISSLVYKILML